MDPLSEAVHTVQIPWAQRPNRRVVWWLLLGSILTFAVNVSGQTVLVAGGSPSAQGPYTNTAEVFDPATNSWNFTANDIPNAPPDNVGGLCAPNMVLLSGGKVLLAGGGCTDSETTTNASSLYDPATGQWTATGTAIPNFMNFGRDQFGMVTLNSGKVLAFAGCAGGCSGPNILGQHVDVVGDSAEIYSLSTNRWTTVAPLTTVRGNLETGNLNQDAVVLQDGRVLTCNGSNGYTMDWDTCEIYDPVANTWTLTAAIGETGIHQLVVLSTGKVLAVLNDGLSASLFDPVSGTWNPTGSLTSMEVAGQLISLSDGRVLDCGGVNSDKTPINTAQIYDPMTGQWSATNPMTTGRAGHVAVLLSDSGVLVAGGEDPDNAILSSAEIFDPSVGTWSATGSMNLGRLQANAVLISTNYALTVSADGSGTVTTLDGFIHCPGVCSHLYPANATVTLSAAPSDGWNFVGWSGACDERAGLRARGDDFFCVVTMTQDLSVAAIFTQTYILTVLNDGGGSVTSTDSNINCPGVCGYSYPVNAVVTLNATPAPGEHFTGWLGVCDGFDSCEVTMAQNQSVRATFGQNSDHYTLIVSVSGSGTVTSADHFINCPGTCRFTYPVDTQVTLNASPGKGSVFTGWSGDCTGNGSCTVTMSQFRSVSATFSGPSDTVVHTFDSANNGGQNPTGSITSDPLGNSYSTTSVGGAFGQGTVFELSPDGTETVLYSFCAEDGCTDGAVPLAGLVQGADGNFYGTTSAGGSSNNAGTVFSINPFGTLTTLHTFCAQSGCMDGSTPYARLVQGTDGNFYGTTSAGGLYAAGTVFQITPSGFTTLHNFCTLDECADGATPYAGLVQGADGNFYGTTHDGGAHSSGTVFQITPTGTLTTLYNFCGQDACADGQNPFAEVIFDNAGNLYGTTAYGGTYGGGTAFELSPNGGGGWTEMVLHSFGDASDGKNPQGGLVFDGYGNLYGTTMNGGLYASGMVFELPNSIKNSANLRCCRGMPLYNFGSTPRDGQNPSATLIWGSSGKLLGTTVKGGDNEAGTVFGVSPPGLANYDPNFAAPVCNQPFQFCDSGPAMLSGHGNMAGGAEPNQPNTIRNSCADGTAGTFHVDESIDELTVETIRGVMLHSGEFVRVTAKVWISDSSVDKLDLYYTRSANNPQWLYIATVTPNGTGAQALSAIFRLAPGAWQAVRANLRKGGNRSSCSTGDYDDHDDLVFVVR